MNLRTQQLSAFYDAAVVPSASLDAVDNLIGHEPSGDLFVAEDGGNLEIGLLNTYGAPVVAPFLRFVGHDNSEVSGIAFSPDNTRLYVASQRGTDGVTGMVFEVSGPFRRPSKRWNFAVL
ncbi:MAG: PhoX family protein [Actinomycetia bacterium]|nr:PhoX family protein [Actinomycetes bacterium]